MKFAICCFTKSSQKQRMCISHMRHVHVEFALALSESATAFLRLIAHATLVWRNARNVCFNIEEFKLTKIA